MKPILLLIDIQNDYFSGGKMELIKMDEATENAQKLLSHFRKNKLPIVFIQHLATKPNASFFIPGTSGAEIHNSIRPLDNETVIIKNFPNSFRNTNLQEHLQSLNSTNLVICGAMSHMCVDTTTRAATDLGYSCTLIADACATRDLVFNDQKVKAADVQIAYMAALNGTFAQVISTDQFMESMIK
ncbi:isochorismatase [Aquipluma nitroreducens]|uniref:Isochorismatase n=1 Tax=Aquipluma nitroreducens TaxID=2010828 RepID=A0A5K7S357_9BACT|nr:cysteine hydrolase family protein [Aquipluma nitroreducens]BBE15973.1 isochorismatase [Aquipluma nitroreducens]